MTVISSIKVPKLFGKKKPISYSLSPLGQVKLDWDKQKSKEAKINGIVSIVVITGMFTLGFLTKEFLVMILATKGMSKLASALVG